ncbi:baseplate multidomain protein megatron [Tropicimonas isoalkanivorans]|uniref:Putative phage tail protein n=1 Tax=Tropicimonas isoalkanivorans TaxID=441112 RepID=A0A1I1E858_9RHOB|nr:glycoside hydrolase TIM-barrel-like domain-containing protein [Tropicimonas isoalkanivorans]SFB83315.1 Putative phage tail protein [Tropicimonas isoalkanivorans]
MATLILGAAGAAIGGAIGGTAFGLSTAIVGRAIGATLGRVIDQRLMGGGSEVIETGRLDRFRLTGASEGSAINQVYGRMRLGGQVIWSSKFKESSKTRSTGGKGGGGGTSTKTYSYSVSLAVALCEGEILRVGRIWADGLELGRDDLDLRVYTGTEGQMPDPKMEAIEGAGNVPAYRGLAYVVFEDLQLARFGNRVPQFSFEVIRATDPAHAPAEAQSLSQTVRAVAMIPGTGEFALATTPVEYDNGFGWKTSANVHSPSGKTDFSTSLEHLTEELPKCESVSLVVSWFGSDLRCGECSIRPKVEHHSIEGNRMSWSVSGTDRSEAGKVPKIDGRPVYGGTPTDQSVAQAIRAIRASGKQVMFYPFILMDQMEGNDLPDPWTGEAGQPALPWRGRITTSIGSGRPGTTDGTSTAGSEVQAFFGTASGGDFHHDGSTVGYSGPDDWRYRRFILHYAHLCALAGGVDAFCIGSEMRSLTQIRGANGAFPAIAEFKRLASDVRAILGADTKIGYCADWSEYFGYQPADDSGDLFFHLDPLWSDPDVNFIGIDNYMPISDWRDGPGHADADWRSIYDVEYLKRNVAGGEGYDWYYADQAGRDAQDRLPIQDGAYSEPWVFRYKDIRNWWSREHHERIAGNRQAEPTSWKPESKPIWFTELGCAAIDKGTNQPNKFLDPKSSESSLPHYSTGGRDDLMQAQYLRAMHLYWEEPANNPTSSVYGGRMVDMSRAHVWAWDARPYPAFPANGDVWGDGDNYRAGHWLNGRTTSEPLAAVVSEICAKSGVANIDVSELDGLVRGYAIEQVSSARGALQPLMLSHGFDANEGEDALQFRTRTAHADSEIDTELLATTTELDGKIETVRAPQAEMAGRIRLNHILADSDFPTHASEAIFPDETSPVVSTSELALSLTGAEGQRIVERWLSESRVARDTVRMTLPPSRMDVAAGDVVKVPSGDAQMLYRVDRVEAGASQNLEATRVEEGVYRPAADVSEIVRQTPFSPPMPVFSVFMDLPLLTGKEDPAAPFVAVAARPWTGSVAVYSSPEDDAYELNRLVQVQSTIGVTETSLSKAAPGVLDRGTPLRVRFGSGFVSSASEAAMMNGANSAAIGNPESGDWEVFQFSRAELVGTDTYELSLRLRGQAGTDGVMPDDWPEGSIVVLLDGGPVQIDLPASMRGLERHYRIGPAVKGYDHVSYSHETGTFSGVGLRPYAPAHLRSRKDANGALTFGWIRRTRVDGDTWQAFDVPLGENRERYLVQVICDGKVVREEIVSDSAWTYTLARRQSDGCTGPFAFRVAQISDQFGAGPFRSLDIDD